MLLHHPIAPGVVAFSTRRQGGVSEGNYASFNCNHYCGDDPQHVRANRQRLADMLGVDYDHIIVPRQTHTTNVARVDSPYIEENSTVMSHGHERTLQDVDAIITDRPGLCLCVSTADCIPVLLYDPDHHAVAAIHAGWRGTVGRIVERTIALMQSEYATRAEALRAVIGPGIGLEAFEVGDEVYEAFREAHFDMSSIARRYPHEGGGERWHLDLWEANRQQLLAHGIPADAIHVSGICTHTHHHDYFSARRLGIHSGRILTGVFFKGF